MRFVSIGKPHVHHEGISVVGAFDPIRTRLWFQSHRDKSHLPNYPVVAKNLRLECTSAFRSRRPRSSAQSPPDARRYAAGEADAFLRLSTTFRVLTALAVRLSF